MPKIAVFDSGLGSMSVVRELQKTKRRAEIIYYADTASFPYGAKSRVQIRHIIQNTISTLKSKFEPDAIIMASNTPTLMLGVSDGYDDDSVLLVGVRPPLEEALRVSQTGRVAILGTTGSLKSAALAQMIRKHTASMRRGRIFRIDGSDLVRMVESGRFLTDKASCIETINAVLGPVISAHRIDVITLSSTHLPFLAGMMKSQYPGVSFVDPARDVAARIFSKFPPRSSDRASLRVYASARHQELQGVLKRIGVRRTVRKF